jgi:hypothetical protein
MKMARHKEPDGPPLAPMTAPGPAASFAHFVARFQKGEMDAVASYRLQSLLLEMEAEARNSVRSVSGKLSLTLNIGVDETGAVAIGFAVETKAPKQKTSQGVYWMDKSGNLTNTNPAQTNLPLHEVPASSSAPREVGGDRPPLREA